MHPIYPSSWQPPTDYQQVQSALEGITVFAPRPEKPQVDKPTKYKCP
jgi:hypothetical protein